MANHLPPTAPRTQLLLSYKCVQAQQHTSGLFYAENFEPKKSPTAFPLEHRPHQHTVHLSLRPGALARVNQACPCC